MVSVPPSMPKTASRNIALAGLVISIVALGLGAYAFTQFYIPRGPAAQTRTFRVSIDFYNATSGTTTYTSARFTPDTLTAFQGDTIVFNVTNRDPRAISSTTGKHGFSLDEAGISTTVDPGAFVTGTFVNAGEGTYRFYCQLHSAHLSGQLVVLRR